MASEPTARKVGHMLYQIYFPREIGEISFEPMVEAATTCLEDEDDLKKNIDMVVDEEGMRLTGEINALHDLMECISENRPEDLSYDDPFPEDWARAQEGLDVLWEEYTEELAAAKLRAIVALKELQQRLKTRYWSPGGALYKKLADRTQVGRPKPEKMAMRSQRRNRRPRMRFTGVDKIFPTGTRLSWVTAESFTGDKVVQGGRVVSSEHETVDGKEFPHHYLVMIDPENESDSTYLIDVERVKVNGEFPEDLKDPAQYSVTYYDEAQENMRTVPLHSIE